MPALRVVSLFRTFPSRSPLPGKCGKPLPDRRLAPWAEKSTDITEMFHFVFTCPSQTRAILSLFQERTTGRKTSSSIILPLYVTRSDASAPGCFFSPVLFPPAESCREHAPSPARPGKRTNITEMFHLVFTRPSRTTIILSLFQERTTGRKTSSSIILPLYSNPERCQRSGLFPFSGHFLSAFLLPRVCLSDIIPCTSASALENYF